MFSRINSFIFQVDGFGRLVLSPEYLRDLERDPDDVEDGDDDCCDAKDEAEAGPLRLPRLVGRCRPVVGAAGEQGGLGAGVLILAHRPPHHQYQHTQHFHLKIKCCTSYKNINETKLCIHSAKQKK